MSTVKFSRMDIIYCLSKKQYGIIKLINDDPQDDFPIEIVFEDGSIEFYTIIGRKYKEENVVLRKIKVIYGKYTFPTPKPRQPTGFSKTKIERREQERRDKRDSESSDEDQ